MQWTLRRRYAWSITLILVLVILGCSGDPDPNRLTGTWTGTIQDSLAGRGTLLLNLSHVNTQLTGTWQSTFPEARNNTGGTLSGTASTRLSGRPSDLVITMVWSPSQADACSFTVDATLDNNDEDHFTGTYAPFNCARPESGSLDVARR